MRFYTQVSGKFYLGLVRLLTRDADDFTVDGFITPGLPVGLTPPDHQGSNINFNWNILESDATPDEWMMMDSHGTFW